MKLRPRIATGLLFFLFILGLAGSTVPALAGVHLWRVKEVFSNASGTIQFIELATCCGSTGEVFTGGQPVRSNSHTFTIPANQTGSTLNKHILLATSGFAALPGAPTPNYTIPSSFLSTAADTISFSVYDTLTFTAGMLPTDGTTSLNRNPDDATHTIFTAVNSPTNYAGQTGSVSAGGPPAVPDGRNGTTPLTIVPTSPDGSSLQISYDLASCNNGANHHILYGQRSNLPAAPGGAFSLLGSVCGIGSTVPYTWAGVPQDSDGAGLIWFVVVATDASGVEGSWGLDSSGSECVGPGNNGASGTCALTKSLSNTCGHASFVAAPPPDSAASGTGN